MENVVLKSAEAYKQDFEKFLAASNEKEIARREILTEMRAHNIDSLLDIGAGNGILSIPLVEHVSSYLAIERNPRFVSQLRSAGLEVIEGEFPLKIGRTFDMVLSSHSLSRNLDPLLFVQKAFDLVSPGGVLLIITYRGASDDWNNLMSALGYKNNNDDVIFFNKITALMGALGKFEVRKVQAFVATSSLQEMIDVLSFVASGTIAGQKEEFLEKTVALSKILDEKYRTAKGYEFPFQHYFLKVIRS